MSDGINAYGGTVIQLLGDGLFALFGAPLAQEDHALRACLAALAIQRNASAAHASGAPMTMRIGIHSGEVLVGTADEYVDAPYRADGSTIHLASRLEQLARPGTVVLSGATYRMVEGKIDALTLGRHPIRGFKTEIDLFELDLGAGSPGRMAAHAPAPRPIIGRKAMLERLAGIGADVRNGVRARGAGIGLVGDAGVGKSRLTVEFCIRAQADGFDVLPTYARSYAGHVPYSLIADLMRTCLNLTPRLDPTHQREIALTALGGLPGAFREHRPAVCDLLGLGEADRAWGALAPTQKRRAIGKALSWLIDRHLATAPVLMVVEDIHLADRESVRLIESVVQNFAERRFLLCATYRSTFTHRWSDTPWFTELQVEPLKADDMRQLASALLGTAPSLTDLQTRLVAKAEGNPFFFEQLAMNLVDQGSLTGKVGAYSYAGASADFRVPASIASVIGARVDHLPPEAKAAVEAAAILGDLISETLVASMLDADKSLIAGPLQIAVAAGLLNAPSSGQGSYSFTHSLVQESVSASLTRARRRTLHRKACDGLLTHSQGQADELASIVLHHAYNGEAWHQAVELALKAMSRAIAHSANREAIRVFEVGLDAAKRMDGDATMLPLELTLRVKALSALLPLGRTDDMIANLERAEVIAKLLGDHRRQAAMRLQLAVIYWIKGHYKPGLDSTHKAATAAIRARNRSLEMAAGQTRLMLHHGVGRYLDVIDEARRLQRRFASELAKREISPGWAILAPVAVKVFLADALARTGNLRGAQHALDAGYRELAHYEHAFSRVLVDLIQASVWVERGHPENAAALLEGAVKLCKAHDLTAMLPPAIAALGGALARIGRTLEAITLLERAVAEKINLQGGRYNEFYLPANLGLALSLAGRHDEAIAAGKQAVEATLAFGQGGHKAEALYMLAETEARAGHRAAAAARLIETQEAAAACGMALVERRAAALTKRLSSDTLRKTKRQPPSIVKEHANRV
jgi:tetratricopeptide (TPR) repeat protein